MAFLRGKTAKEKESIFEDIVCKLELGYSLTDIGIDYNTSRQTIEQFLARKGYDFSSTLKANLEKRRKQKEIDEIDYIKADLENKYEIKIAKLQAKNVELASALQYFKKKSETIGTKVEKDKRIQKLLSQIEHYKAINTELRKDLRKQGNKI